MVGLAVVLVFYWQLSAKRKFVGPSKTDEAALRKLEAAFEALLARTFLDQAR